MNLCDVVLQRARQFPDAIAFLDDERTVTYRELEGAVHLCAAGLAARGIGEGARVALDVGDVVRHLVLTLAIARLRAVSVSMPDAGVPGERLARLQAVGVRYLLAPKPTPELDALEFIAADASLTRGHRPAPSAGHAAAADELPFRIIWSSGSTGTPKPIACTHARLLALVFAQQSVVPYGPDTTIYLGMSMQVFFALVHGLRTFTFGGRVVGHVSGGRETFERCRALGVTHFVSTPAIAGPLVAALPEGPACLPSMQIFLGGGPVPPPMRAMIADRLTPRLHIIYGTTETGLTALTDPQILAAHPQAAGRVVPWMQVEAVDEQRRPLPPGTVGHLRIRGIGMAREYLDDAGATARAFHDGWFHPGDLGHVTRDGLVVVQGRSVDVLSIGGNKTSPQVIEEALERCPQVAEAAAFVASSEDGRQWLAAAVVPRGAFDRDALRAWCREHLGPAAPTMIVPIESVPRSGMGKVMRGDLARRFVVRPSVRPASRGQGTGVAPDSEAAG